jgi:hypothetical protein
MQYLNKRGGNSAPLFKVKLNKMKKFLLIVEKSKDGKLWGRIELDDDLMIDSANSLVVLERKMKKVLQKFHQIDESKIEFDLAYDLSALFSQMDYLNVSAIAAKARINPGLMRQYVSGFKYPSQQRAKAIEETIKNIGQELIGVKVAIVKASPKKTIKRQKLHSGNVALH